MNDFDIGPSTISRVEVDEEPPGSPCQSHSCHSPLPVQQRLWPLTLPEPPRREILRSPQICRPSFPRVTARQGFSQGLLPRRDRQAVERLAMACPQLASGPASNSRKCSNCPTDEREGLDRAGEILPVATTPYYMSLISADDPQQPLRRTIIPTASEFTQTRGESADPLGEDHDSATPGMVHRYPDRVLLLALDFCSSYCRYCTRSRVVGQGDIVPNEARLKQAFEYLRNHKEVRDVLISGGDPLFMSDDKLDWILTNLRSIPHLEFVRIGTKMPAVLPQRITRELCRMLRKHHPLWMSLHFAHPDECTPESYQACAASGRRGHPPGLADRVAAGHQRQRADHEVADAPHAQNAGPAVLSLPVRPDHRLRPFPHPGVEGAGDHRGPSRTYDRLCRADVRDRRSRAAAARSPCCPTTSSAATAKTCCCGISKARPIDIPTPRAL